jgi:CheY-like chemotaxis protein
MRNNILVVDDEPMLVEMISRCLTAKGYRVTTANNGGKIFLLSDVVPF